MSTSEDKDTFVKNMSSEELQFVKNLSSSELQFLKRSEMQKNNFKPGLKHYHETLSSHFGKFENQKITLQAFGKEFRKFEKKYFDDKLQSRNVTDMFMNGEERSYCAMISLTK